MHSADNDLLKSYCHKWGLDCPSFIAKSPSSELFRVRVGDYSGVLKILTPLGRISEGRAATILHYFNGYGAAKLLNSDDGAYLIEFIDGPFLKDVVGGDSLNDLEASKIICELLGKIHKRPIDTPLELPSMEQNFEALFSCAQRAGRGFWSEAADLAEKLLATEQERVLLHGDIHHKNILKSPDRGWLLIDPKGLIGESTYDFANVFYNPDDQPSLVENPDRIMRVCSLFADRFGISTKRILEFALAFGALSACWAIEDGLNPARRLRIAGIIQKLLASGAVK